jgi:hypothetical protein
MLLTAADVLRAPGTRSRAFASITPLIVFPMKHKTHSGLIRKKRFCREWVTNLFQFHATENARIPYNSQYHTMLKMLLVFASVVISKVF